MRNLFLIGMAAVGMMCASCSSDENVEMANNKNAIEFKTFVNNSTRIANDATTDNLMKFKIWGRFESKDGTKKGAPFVARDMTKTGGVWSYGTPVVYWEKDYKYSFQALAPHDAYTFTAPTEYGEWGLLTFDNKIGETDLIYAAKDCSLYSGGSCPGPVNLTFDHLLSRVRFQFTNGMDDGSEVRVTDVKITNAYANGTATLAASIDAVVWTTSNPKDLVFGNMTAKVDDKTGRSDHKYMIPTTAATEYTITFNVTRVHHGVTDVYNHTAKVSLALQPNKSYQLTATLNKDNINPGETLCPIEFAVSVNPWENFTDKGMTM